MVKEREDSEDLTAKINNKESFEKVINSRLGLYESGGFVWARVYGPGPNVPLCSVRNAYLFLELD